MQDAPGMISLQIFPGCVPEHALNAKGMAISSH